MNAPIQSTPPADALELAQALMRCPSVTPVDAGALDVMEGALKPLGFACHRLPFEQPGTDRVDNLYARIGTKGRNFCYAGHTDVVPPGDRARWSVDPFGAVVKDGYLWGRGASDMKAAIACFVSALRGFLGDRGPDFGGSVSLLITGDEEGPAINGTVKVLEWLKARGETLDSCIVGEPSNPDHVGEMAKIGRRGAMTGYLTVHGVQGHTAYPQLADNPLHRLVPMMQALIGEPMDKGNRHFQPTTLQIATIDVGNPVSNVIPGACKATFNIRFSSEHTSKSVEAWVRQRLDKAFGAPGHNGPARYDISFNVSGESFLTPPGPLSKMVCEAVEGVTGKTPELSTTGGTSDARFIKAHCPVCEFGMTNATAHKFDERCSLADMARLVGIYRGMLDRYFA
ncbi:MAG: succinyl-diaminopimelate desuccinylase [Alphaproteobacteria bacterium]|nr:succinyl-diaminopimelate desuccinylase [Alphaproteobacteria bacterium]